MSLSNGLKLTALAGLIGLGVCGAAATPAAAATYETRCYGDNCYRMRCNDFGYNCSRIDYYGDVAYMRDRDRLMCDEDGDNCHWVRTRVYDYDDFDDFTD
jgi:hypothetical protein